MPTISKFSGITLFMNYNDRQPPRLRARYQDHQEITVEIESGIVEGTMSRRALRTIFEWLDQHQAELMKNSELARDRRALEQVAP